MRIHLTCIFLLIAVITGSTFAADAADGPDYRNASLRTETTLHGATLGAAKADTVVVYGGPGNQEGKFELANGTPDWGGWTSVDDTRQPQKWQVSDFHCDNIGAGGPGNHAWWCGEVFADECGGNHEGYGSNWYQRLEWSGVVANVDAPTEVCITWDMNFDTEPGEDYLWLLLDDGAEWPVELGRWDGTDTALDTTICFTVAAGAYTRVGNDEIVLRFQFSSDGAWDDEDCRWPTDGACQIDDIEVRFDGVLQGTVEDCDANPLQWYYSAEPYVGDFAQLWTALGDADPCNDNPSTVAAFIDDGSLEGLDGSPCITHCYGPDGYIVNTTGGLAGPNYHIENHIVSPIIQWPVGYDGALLDFDVYTDFEYGATDSPGIYYHWSVRSTADPSGVTGWTEWDDRNNIYDGGPVWSRDRRLVSDLLVGDRRWVQCRLGAIETGWYWNEVGDDGSPAPYFDNVRLRAFTLSGPSVATTESLLAQDDFPVLNGLDPVDLGNNFIRFDMAAGISRRGVEVNNPGDSLVITVLPIRAGSSIVELPRMYWRMKANPIFDGVRTLPDGAVRAGDRVSGYVEADTVRTQSWPYNTAKENEWAFDLEDYGFFFPGDVIHYYFRATDWVDGIGEGVTLLPGDTTGYNDFNSILSYDRAFTVRGLPSLYDDGAKGLTHPPILFWHDFGDRPAEEEWHHALTDLGYGYMTDYDVYYTNSPAAGVGNGLGGRAHVNHLVGYETMLYSSEDLATLTITNLDWDLDKGADLGRINNWLALGDRNMVLFGDNLVSDLLRSTQGATFVGDQLGLSLHGDDLAPHVGMQTALTVRPVAADPVFVAGMPVTEWLVWGSCPNLRTFDAVVPTDAQNLAHFESPDGMDAYPFSAASLMHHDALDNDLILLPYGFGSIRTPAKAPTPSAARTWMLEKILLYFGSVGSGLAEVPEHGGFDAKSFPNPFNPSTKLAWSMPARAEMTIEIFDLRGGLVRTLIDDEMVEATGSRVWNGRDDSGAQVASGVYFAKIRGGEYERTLKLALVK